MKTFNSPDELFIRVDEQDMIIGSVSRKEANSNPHIIHRAVAVLLFNDRDELLLQKRSLHKDTFPGAWDLSASGHVTFGEDYLDAAVRETREELGIALDPGDLIQQGKVLVQLPWENEYQMIYSAVLPKDASLAPLRDELSDTEFVRLGELERMMNDESVEFANWAEIIIDQFVLNG